MGISKRIKKHFKPGYEIRRFTTVNTDTGGYVEEWTTVQTVAGHIRPLSGSERVVANQIELEATHRFYAVDYFDVRHGDRIRNAGVDYEVVLPIDVNGYGKLLQVDLKRVERKRRE